MSRMIKARTATASSTIPKEPLRDPRGDPASFVKQGEEVHVVDNGHGGDLTAVTLRQIILREERKNKASSAADGCARSSSRGKATLQDLATRVDRSMEAIGSIGEKAAARPGDRPARAAAGQGPGRGPHRFAAKAARIVRSGSTSRVNEVRRTDHLRSGRCKKS